MQILRNLRRRWILLPDAWQYTVVQIACLAVIVWLVLVTR